jgi:pimeloyl-ACP methyl ester carboxylesterase
MRIPFLRHIYHQTKSDVLLVAYRGYSNSDGSPTEEGLQLDGQAVLSYAIDYRAKELSNGRKKDLFVLGRSLGGAVSIYLATRDHLKD